MFTGNAKDNEKYKFFEDQSGEAVVRTGSDSKNITLVSQAGSFIYLGEALTGSATSASVWKITRIEISGNDVSILLADTGNFTQVWDNRGALTYG